MGRLLTAAALVVLASSMGAALASTAGADEGGTPDCVTYWGEARYGAYGYDHIVHVQNSCDALAHCKVWTSVNDEKHRVDVAAGEHEQVLTWRGSPAREFTAYAACRLEQ